MVEKTHSTMCSTLESEVSCNYDVKIPLRGEYGACFEYTHKLCILYDFNWESIAYLFLITKFDPGRKGMIYEKAKFGNP